VGLASAAGFLQQAKLNCRQEKGAEIVGQQSTLFLSSLYRFKAWI
jgi:hypothetical protein